MGTGERMGNRTYIQEQEIGGGGGETLQEQGAGLGSRSLGFRAYCSFFSKRLNHSF